MISKEDIENLANLARLKLKPEEEEKMASDISNILGYVGQVNSFNAEAAQTERPLLRNVMRTDEPRGNEHPLTGKEEALRVQFPRREGGYNVVRKIIQKDE